MRRLAPTQRVTNSEARSREGFVRSTRRLLYQEIGTCYDEMGYEPNWSIVALELEEKGMSLALEGRKRPDMKQRKVKCPKCGAEIDHLKVIAENLGTLRIEGGEATYEWASDIYGGSIIGTKFKCPECYEVLFTDQCAAEGFLLGI
jgi:predicted RNA-binding Zn-ribbon protein involved in translation (DUF1610 family)